MPVFPLNPHFKFRILEKWLKIFRSTKADNVTKESVAFADRERASSIPLSCFLTLFYIPVLLRWWVDCVWLMWGVVVVGLGASFWRAGCCMVVVPADTSMPTQDAFVWRFSAWKANGHCCFLVLRTKFLSWWGSWSGLHVAVGGSPSKEAANFTF